MEEKKPDVGLQPRDPKLPGFRAEGCGNRSELRRTDAPLPENNIEL